PRPGRRAPDVARRVQRRALLRLDRVRPRSPRALLRAEAQEAPRGRRNGARRPPWLRRAPPAFPPAGLHGGRPPPPPRRAARARVVPAAARDDRGRGVARATRRCRPRAPRRPARAGACGRGTETSPRRRDVTRTCGTPAIR